MGFHLRKSFNFKGIRFNLSNSGIGISTGIKGLRVGIDGKGRKYIGGGKGIIRYRKQIGSKTNNKDNISNILILFGILVFLFFIFFVYLFIK